MIALPTINYNGGCRTYYDVQVKVTKTIDERHWKNLWMIKTKKIYLEVVSIPEGSFKNAFDEVIKFPKSLIIHDFAGDFLNLTIGEFLSMKFGYVDSDQQYWHGLKTFTASILKNKEELQLI
jgi:hypothetical protein